MRARWAAVRTSHCMCVPLSQSVCVCMSHCVYVCLSVRLSVSLSVACLFAACCCHWQICVNGSERKRVQKGWQMDSQWERKREKGSEECRASRVQLKLVNWYWYDSLWHRMATHNAPDAYQIWPWRCRRQFAEILFIERAYVICGHGDI